jgi:hypothetical protein
LLNLAFETKICLCSLLIQYSTVPSHASQLAPTLEAAHRPSCKTSSCRPSSSWQCSVQSSTGSLATCLVHENLLESAKSCALRGEHDNIRKTAQKATAHTHALVKTKAHRLHCSAQAHRGMHNIFIFGWFGQNRKNKPRSAKLPSKTYCQFFFYFTF